MKLFKKPKKLLPPLEECEANLTEAENAQRRWRLRRPPVDPKYWFNIIEHNDLSSVKRVLKRADIDAQMFHKELCVTVSGLHLAVLHGHDKIVRALINAGCDIEAFTKAGEYVGNELLNATPLHFAVIQKDMNIVRTLLNAGSNVSTRFMVYRRTGKDNSLIEMDSVYHAASVGFADILTELLRHGGNPDSKVRRFSDGIEDDSALHIAVQNGDIEVIKRLLTQGANVDITNIDVWTPLAVAIAKGNSDVVDTLLKEGKPSLEFRFLTVDQKECLTHLQMACLRNRELIGSLLIKAGSDVNSICPLSGKTALHIAGRAGNREVVRLLIRHGADVNIRDRCEKTAFQDTKDGSNHHGILAMLANEQKKLREIYSIIDRTSAGVCLILFNEHFSEGVDLVSLPDSNDEAEKLKQAFTHVGYKVRLHTDLTSTQMSEVLDSAMENLVKPHHESFVCCIKSHGYYGCVYGRDGRRVNIGDLTNKVKACCCSKLANKMKVFIIDACQGDGQDIHLAAGAFESGRRSESSPSILAQPDTPDHKVLPEENFTIWHSSLPGNVSYVSSHFFSVLAQRLMEIGGQPIDFTTVQKDVAERIAQNVIDGRYKQVPSVQSSELSSAYTTYFHERLPSN